eukprot:3686333-Amphidinium_carterae.1
MARKAFSSDGTITHPPQQHPNVPMHHILSKVRGMMLTLDTTHHNLSASKKVVGSNHNRKTFPSASFPNHISVSSTGRAGC